MGLERIGDLYSDNIKYVHAESKPCYNPEHNPPSHYLYQPGKYRYTCPGCGKVTTFDVYPEGSWL